MSHKTWVELGDHRPGLHLLVYRGPTNAAGQLTEKPDQLHDVKLSQGAVIAEELRALGFRALPDTQRNTAYGKAWDVEEAG